MLVKPHVYQYCNLLEFPQLYDNLHLLSVFHSSAWCVFICTNNITYINTCVCNHYIKLQLLSLEQYQIIYIPISEKVCRNKTLLGSSCRWRGSMTLPKDLKTDMWDFYLLMQLACLSAQYGALSVVVVVFPSLVCSYCH